MNSYKAQTQLNEKDSLQDMLNSEKELVKMYCTAYTEGNGRAFRTLVKNNMLEVATDQFDVFSQMTSHGYYEVQPADKSTIDQQKAMYKEISNQLSN